VNTRVVLAVVGAAHGVAGEVRVTTFLDDPAALGAYGPLTTADGRTLNVASLRPAKGAVMIVHFREIGDRTAAESLRGQDLSVPRAALPPVAEDTFYHADLVGLRAETDQGASLGTVAAIYDFGAGDVIEVRGPAGTVFYPFTKAVVPVVDLARGRVVILPPGETVGREG
jgi:16S rRNA processing protein RimM